MTNPWKPWRFSESSGADSAWFHLREPEADAATMVPAEREDGWVLSKVLPPIAGVYEVRARPQLGEAPPPVLLAWIDPNRATGVSVIVPNAGRDGWLWRPCADRRDGLATDMFTPKETAALERFQAAPIAPALSRDACGCSRHETCDYCRDLPGKASR